MFSLERSALEQLTRLLGKCGNALKLIDALTQSANVFLNHPKPFDLGVIVFGRLLDFRS